MKLKQNCETENAIIIARNIQEEGWSINATPSPAPVPVIGLRLREETVRALKDVVSLAMDSPDKPPLLSVIRSLDRVAAQLADSLPAGRDTPVIIEGVSSYDDYSYLHSLNVAILSVSLGQFLELEREELTSIAKAALLHDIGNITRSMELVHSPAFLIGDELNTFIKRHPRTGYDSLRNIGAFDEDICETVLYHHEKMDGTGYPEGLMGKRIPFWSRIIAVADIYDAMTSIRPNRRSMRQSEALEHIMGGAGSVFDCNIVYALTKKLGR